MLQMWDNKLIIAKCLAAVIDIDFISQIKKGSFVKVGFFIYFDHCSWKLWEILHFKILKTTRNNTLFLWHPPHQPHTHIHTLLWSEHSWDERTVRASVNLRKVKSRLDFNDLKLAGKLKPNSDSRELEGISPVFLAVKQKINLHFMTREKISTVGRCDKHLRIK